MEITLKIEYSKNGKVTEHFPYSESLLSCNMDICTRKLNKKQCEDIAKKYCSYFNLPPVKIVFTDSPNVPESNSNIAGLYFYYDPHVHPIEMCNSFSIKLFKETDGQTLGVLLHELSHHLAFQQYKCFRESPHGYSFSLARNRTRTWSKKVFGEKVKFN